MLNNFNIKNSIDVESIDDVILIQKDVKCFFEISKKTSGSIKMKTFGSGNEKFLQVIYNKIAGNKSVKTIISDFLLTVEENDDTAIMALNKDESILFVGFFIREKGKERYRPAEEILDIYVTEDDFSDKIDPKEIHFFPTLIDCFVNDTNKTRQFIISKIHNAMNLLNVDVAIISDNETQCDVVRISDINKISEVKEEKEKEKETE